MMRAEVVSHLEDIPALEGRWNELALGDRRDGFFRTFQWYAAWMRHIRPDAEPFVIVVRDGSGQITGLAPLCRMVYRDHGFRLTAVSPAGRDVVSGDFLDYLAVPGQHQQVLDAALNRLWESRSEWDLLIAAEVPEGEDLDRNIESFAAAHELPLRRQEERICPYIELPASWEEYLRNLSQKMRYEMRRDTRELLEKRGATVRVLTGAAAADQIGTLIRLHLAHWQHVNEPGTLARPGFPEFLGEVCAELPSGASARLYILEADGQAAAALLAFWFGDSALFYQTGWDPNSAVARMSPGMVLVGKSIRDAIEGGFRYFDFLRGDESYKCRLTKSSRKTATLLVARSFLAKRYLRVAGWKDSVKRLINVSAAEAVS